MYKYLLFFTITSVLFTSCDSSFKLLVQENKHSDMVYANDYQVAISDKPISTIAAYGYGGNGEMAFDIVCHNKEANRIDLLPQKIKVFAIRPDGSEKEVYTYLPEKYLRKIKTAKSRAAFSQTMQNISDQSQAGYSRSRTTSASVSQKRTSATGVATDGYNSAVGVGVSRSTTGTIQNSETVTYDKSKELEARDRAEIRWDRTSSQFDSWYTNADNSLLKATTLSKGQKVRGIVVSTLTGYKKFEVRIDLGSEHHILYFEKK